MTTTFEMQVSDRARELRDAARRVGLMPAISRPNGGSREGWRRAINSKNRRIRSKGWAARLRPLLDANPGPGHSFYVQSDMAEAGATARDIDTARDWMERRELRRMLCAGRRRPAQGARALDPSVPR